MAARVADARHCQSERYKEVLLADVEVKLNVTARGYHRILKIALTMPIWTAQPLFAACTSPKL